MSTVNKRSQEAQPSEPNKQRHVEKDEVAQVVSKFQNGQSSAWDDYVKLATWVDRELVSHVLRKANESAGFQHFLESYKNHMQPYFCDSFYEVLEKDMSRIAKKYREEGSIDIPLLKLDCLDEIAQWSVALESKGNSRYQSTRTVYPPGEVKQWDQDDPRKNILSEANLVAVGSTKMEQEDTVQWIYHSPHLQLFVQQAMALEDIYPYHSDLGVAVNVMKPSPDLEAKTALGFHFDTIDSSVKESLESGNINSRGATGVIGIQDCLQGGERVSYPQVNRKSVHAVKTIVDKFDPLNPSQTFAIHSDGAISHDHSTSLLQVEPLVVREPISGVLSLFNGGDILHGVSSVREGVRVATVFLYCESDPVESQSTVDSASAFYDQ